MNHSIAAAADATGAGAVRAYRYGPGARSPDPRPLIALDVDGVIALEDPSVPATRHTVEAWDKWRREITIADGTAEMIAHLAERCEIAWTSAWSYNAHEALREPLDLPDEPWAFIPVQFDAATAIAQYAAGRRWAWITEAQAPSDAGPAPSSGTIVEVPPQEGVAGLDAEALFARLGASSRRS